jgi:hypothetical protein
MLSEVYDRPMKLLAPLAVIFCLVAAGCDRPNQQKSLTAEQASAQRIAHLEQKVNLLQRVITSMERPNRRPGSTNRPPVAISTNSPPGDAEEKHQAYEEVMNTLAEDVAGLEEGEQTVNQRIQAITEAIIALEQAVLALDAEMRQMR